MSITNRFSRFVSVLEKNENHYLFNSLTGGLVRVDAKIAKSIQNDKNCFFEDNPDKELIEYLKEAGYLKTESEDEELIIQLKYRRLRGSFQGDQLSLVIAPTLYCNFKCPYCYEKDLPNISMSNDVQDQLIDFIKKRENQFKHYIISWHGGEPTMSLSAIERILDQLHEQVQIPLSRHSMISNGYHLNDTFFKLFKKYPLNKIQITIDGDRKTHNENRISKSGKETYDVIINNIDRLIKEFPSTRVVLRMNVHKNNASQFLELHHVLSDKWNNKNINITPAFVLENANCSVPCFNSKEKTLFMYEISKAIGKKYNDFDLQLNSGHCTAHFESSFVIDPSGFIYKCWVDVGKPDRAVGNTKDGITNMQLVSKYMIGTDKFTDPKCLECSLLPICDGGCSRYRFSDEHKTNDLCPVSEKEIINFMV